MKAGDMALAASYESENLHSPASSPKVTQRGGAKVEPEAFAPTQLEPADTACPLKSATYGRYGTC